MITDEELTKKYGITMECEFVPWSKSRYFDPEKHIGHSPNGGTYLKVNKATLNWKITLFINGKRMTPFDYTAGIAHAPSYKNWNIKEVGCKFSLDHCRLLEYEVENGKVCNFRLWSISGSKPIIPKLSDVVYCIAADCYVLDYPRFDEWAVVLGYNPDSIKDRGIYDACLAQSLEFMNLIGYEKLKELREEFQDY